MTGPGVLQRALRTEYRNEIALLLGLLAFTLSIGTPAGAYALGVVAGAVLALNAFGVVLIYRSNGFINFAQVAVGASVAGLFTVLVGARPLMRLIGNICPGCVDYRAPGALATYLNYGVSLVAALSLSIFLGWIIYHAVIKRFRDGGSMMLTVVTVFVAQTVVTLVAPLAGALITEEQQDQGFSVGTAVSLPFDFTVRIGNVNFEAADVLALVVAVASLVGLAVYLRFSATGNAIRAAADNGARARTLGIPVTMVTGRVWALAGLLSGLAALLAVSGGSVGGGAAGEGVLVQILVVAVIARLTSLPAALVAALALGVLRQALLAEYGTLIALDASLFVILGVVLMLQRRRTGRAEAETQALMQAAQEVRPIPQELRPLPPVRKWLRIGAFAVSVVAVGAPWVLSPAQTNLATLYLIFAMVGFSLLVLTGWAGQISLGQFAFCAVGAYVAAVSGVPFLLALLLGGLTAAVVAVVVGIPALRLRGLHLAVMSLAFAVSVSAVGLNPTYLGRYLPDNLPRPSLLGMSLDDQRVFYYVTLALLIAMTASVAGLRRSRTARALIAARDNEQAAQSFGINLVKARLMAFCISGFLAGFAGVLFAYHQNGVQGASFLPSQGLQMFMLTVVGGLGAVWGPLVGAAYFGLPVVMSLPALFVLVTTGIGALVLLQYAGAGGIAKLVIAVRDAMLRRLARRNRIIVPSLVADIKDTGEERPPLAPKRRAGGGSEFVPQRYTLPRQWGIEMKAHLIKPGEVAGVAGEHPPIAPKRDREPSRG